MRWCPAWAPSPKKASSRHLNTAVRPLHQMPSRPGTPCAIPSNNLHSLSSSWTVRARHPPPSLRHPGKGCHHSICLACSRSLMIIYNNTPIIISPLFRVNSNLNNNSNHLRLDFNPLTMYSIGGSTLVTVLRLRMTGETAATTRHLQPPGRIFLIMLMHQTVSPLVNRLS
jgi:hypothetical protein